MSEDGGGKDLGVTIPTINRGEFNRDNPLYLSFKEHHLRQVQAEVDKHIELSPIHEGFKTKITEFIAESATVGAMRLGIDPSKFSIILSDDEDFGDNVFNHDAKEKLTAAAKFKPNGPSDFFIILSTTRLTDYIELMRASPARMETMVRTVVEEVGHEIYHGYQYLYNDEERTSIPDPDVDLEGYLKSPGETNAREFATYLVDDISKQKDFKKRIYR